MISTFVDVTLRSTRNRFVYRLKRLRDPRYLVGAVAGLAYLWFIFFRNTQRPTVRTNFAMTGDLAVDALSIFVFFIMLIAWALPQDSGGLTFSEAEIATLFPAPLRRRDLLLYKIIRAQPQALISALAFYIFGWRSSYAIGVWAALTVLGVYFTMVSLGRARLKQMHIGFIARLLIVLLIIAGLGWLCAGYITEHPVSITKNDPKDTLRQIDGALHSGPLGVILFLPRIIAGAAVPPSLVQFAISLAGAAVLGVLFFFIAARLNVSFEEGSIAAAVRRAARIESLRSRQSGKLQVSYRRFGPLFRLGETGPPEVAIVWKNVIALVRTAFGIIVLLLALAAGMAAIAFWSREQAAYMVVGNLFLMLTALFPLSGSQIFANDLRLDLARSEILKSYPLQGHRLVAAELAAPLVVITAIDVIFALGGWFFIRMAGDIDRAMKFGGTPQFIISLLILVLPVCAMLLLIRNAVPLYFPAWSMRAPDDVRSFVTIGQKIVILLANLFALVFAMIPAALVFAPSLWIAIKFFHGHPIFMAVATVPAAVVLVGEIWLGIRLLGTRFDDMDVSNEFEVVAV